jgi:selT/selW/selH-like putative selenoprotein
VAEELKKSFGAEVEQIEGRDGIFDVKVDGKLIFSKYDRGRFPSPGEVTALLKHGSPAAGKA